jgi:hypothetical protein
MAKENADFDEEEFSGTSVYNEESREDLVADDEISAEEEGFMKGYDDATEIEEDTEEKEDEES